MLIKRNAEKTLKKLSKGYPVITVTGPRQSGKTTLVKKAFPGKDYVSFEDLDKLELAQSDPRGFLSGFGNGVIIDEAQRYPQIFSYIQTAVDERKKMGEYILTGSQQFGLMSKITQSLAGRTGLVSLLPFSTDELAGGGVMPENQWELVYKGFYPPLYDRKLESRQWYSSYVSTYLERDVHSMLNIKDLSAFRMFLKMCAARTGQNLNLSSLANDCGITHNTAKSWISVLEASYIVFLLQPYFKNFGKRLVKMPKLYFYDTGLVSWLLGIQGAEHLEIHPQRGALFETFVISEMLKKRFNGGLTSNLYFWRDNIGDEIDVIVDNGDSLIPVEIKSGETIAGDYTAGLKKWAKITGKKTPAYLVYSGKSSFVNKNIKILPWNEINNIL